MPDTNGDREKVLAEVLTTEQELVLKAFQDFKTVVKQRKMGGELRIALEVSRETGEPEIIYIGDHFKRSLEPVRTVYKKQAMTFGGRGTGARGSQK